MQTTLDTYVHPTREQQVEASEKVADVLLRPRRS